MKTDLYLIIGLTKESRHWSKEFLDELKKKFNPNSIQLVDLPGSGKFSNQNSPTSIPEIVNQARSQLTFNSNHRRIAISISMGGICAWSWCVQYPNDFTDLVIINSSFAGLSPFWKRLHPLALYKFVKIAISRRPESKEDQILELCANNKAKASAIYPEWVRIAKESTMSLPNTMRQLFAAMKFDPSKKPKIPLLLIASQKDRLAHYSCSQAIAKHAGVPLVLINDPEVGHAFHVDAPQLLSETIHQWSATKTN